MRESFCVFLYDEPARASRGVGENRVGIGDSSIADPLLVAIDLVTDNLAVFENGICCCLERAEIAAGFGLGGAIGKQDSFFGDAAEPVLLLLWGCADGDGIAAQESCEHRRRDPQVDVRHLFADEIDIEGTAAETSAVFRNKQKLNA